MTTLTFRITPLSKRILLSEYGQEPLRFDRNELIQDQLRTIRFNSRGYQPRTLEWLSETITITVHDDLARFVCLKNSNIGIALFNYHREVMLRFVEVMVSMNVPAREAIRRFYAKHGIDEYDYSSESAYRRWTDYSAKRKEKRALSVSEPLHAAKRERTVEIRESDTVIYLKMNEIINQLNAARGKVPVYFPRQLQYYLLYKCAHYSMRRISCIVGCSQTSVSRAVKSIEAWINSDTYIRTLINEAFYSSRFN
jgi:hypothetical protein